MNSLNTGVEPCEEEALPFRVVYERIYMIDVQGKCSLYRDGKGVDDFYEKS